MGISLSVLNFAPLQEFSKVKKKKRNIALPSVIPCVENKHFKVAWVRHNEIGNLTRSSS